MKLLIVGAKGMLGQELKKEAEKRGFEVFAWDRNEIDITDKNTVKEKILALRPEIIINSAAYNAVDKAETDRVSAELLNGLAVGYLAETAKEIDAVFVHYSTDYIFSGENKEGYKESDAPSPVSVYGASKFLGEKEAQKAEKFYLIRLSRLFGNSGTGEACKKSFIESMLGLSEGRDSLEVVNEEFSSPTYAPDLAKYTFDIIERKMPFGIYHGAGDGACTWFEFASVAFELAGKNIKLYPVSADKFPRPAKRPKYSVLINTKMPPQRNWREALKEFLNQ